jgi:transposase-like protein
MDLEDTKNKFLELRSQGRTYGEIAQEIGIDEKQLMEWTREFQEKLKSKDCGC